MVNLSDHTQNPTDKVSAYGMTKKQIESLVKVGDASHATGKFSLLSFYHSTLISDVFLVGERIETGHVLMEISIEGRDMDCWSV